MKDQFVPYELALKLKELGFDEKCIAIHRRDGLELSSLDYIDYEGLKGCRNSELLGYWYNIAAPLWQQSFDWFREKYELLSYIDKYPIEQDSNRSFYVIRGNLIFTEENGEVFMSGWFNSYEEARLACLTKLIEIIS